jgi:ATP-dependent Clp protease adapter protein ClpS
MKSYDKYDLLIEYCCGDALKSGIPESILELNMDRIMKLANEIGVKLNNEYFALLLLNDDINDMMSVTLSIYECCGSEFGNDESMAVMMEAHNSGSAIIKRGPYHLLKEMKDKLNERNLTVCIRRISENE